jgi:triosephosphate isomerase (TIM)
VRRRVVAGNWKMHGSTTSIEALLGNLRLLRVPQIDVLLFPPAAYLTAVVAGVRGSALKVGAQNAHPEPQGPFTGEVSAEMIRDVGATHLLVGHSERRRLFGESDELVAQKFAAALRAALEPVLCVGETLSEREAGRAEEVVSAQLKAVVGVVGVEALRHAMIAYEPVWAIGTGRSATPDDAQRMHRAIRGQIGALDASIAAELRILYGGSINERNAATLFAGADVDGGLVGGASLDAGQFVKICRAA